MSAWLSAIKPALMRQTPYLRVDGISSHHLVECKSVCRSAIDKYVTPFSSAPANTGAPSQIQALKIDNIDESHQLESCTLRGILRGTLRSTLRGRRNTGKEMTHTEAHCEGERRH